SSSVGRGTRTQRRIGERTGDGAARNRDPGGAVEGERGNRAAQAGRSREDRTIARTGARENGRPRAGGRPHATRADRKHTAQSRQAPLDEESARGAAVVGLVWPPLGAHAQQGKPTMGFLGTPAAQSENRILRPSRGGYRTGLLVLKGGSR